MKSKSLFLLVTVLTLCFAVIFDPILVFTETKDADGRIVLKGYNLIDTTLIVAKGETLCIEYGATLEFKNAGIHIEGDLQLIGDSNKPITISSFGNEPFLGITVSQKTLTLHNIRFVNILMGLSRMREGLVLVEDKKSLQPNDAEQGDETYLTSYLCLGESITISECEFSNISPPQRAKKDMAVRAFCSLIQATDSISISETKLHSIKEPMSTIDPPIALSYWLAADNVAGNYKLSISDSTLTDCTFSSIMTWGSINLNRVNMTSVCRYNNEIHKNGVDMRFFIRCEDADEVSITQCSIVELTEKFIGLEKIDYIPFAVFLSVNTVREGATICVKDNILSFSANGYYSAFLIQIPKDKHATVYMCGNIVKRDGQNLMPDSYYERPEKEKFYSYDSIYVGINNDISKCIVKDNVFAYNGRKGLSVAGVNIEGCVFNGDNMSISFRRTTVKYAVSNSCFNANKVIIYSEAWKMRDTNYKDRSMYSINDCVIVAKSLFISDDIKANGCTLKTEQVITAENVWE